MQAVPCDIPCGGRLYWHRPRSPVSFRFAFQSRHLLPVFGSAQAIGLNVDYCDGVVRSIEYGLTSAIQRGAGSRLTR